MTKEEAAFNAIMYFKHVNEQKIPRNSELAEQIRKDLITHDAIREFICTMHILQPAKGTLMQKNIGLAVSLLNRVNGWGRVNEHIELSP